jgi:hypothetical protein
VAETNALGPSLGFAKFWMESSRVSMSDTSQVEGGRRKPLIIDVKDTELRDELLRAVTKEDHKDSTDSVIIRELERLGFNPHGSREFIMFNAKFEAYAGIVGSAIFMMVGIVMLVTPFAPLGLFFVPMGGFGIYYSQKLLKAITGEKEGDTIIGEKE